MKVSFFDKRILHKFYGVLSVISVLTSILFRFVEISQKCKVKIGFASLCILITIYVVLWLHANLRRSISLKINTSEIEIKFGDIFEEQAELKAIGFNEYFDTIVDDTIISKSSLHGQYIEKFYKGRTAELDRIISSNTHLAEARLGETPERIAGKKVRYKLGTIVVVNDYLLTALSRFDENNKAYLEIDDYINCLLNFWNEIDRVYAGRTVALPILGSGITRFKGYENISDQELIELIIWTFKVSRIKFTYPSKVKIIVWDQKRNHINLLRLKKLE